MCWCSHIWLFCHLIFLPFRLSSRALGIQTVELSDCEKTQALALQVLLSLSKFNQHRIHEMDCYHGYSMIHQVLIKSKCIVGYHMLKVSHTLNSAVPPTSPDALGKKHIHLHLFSPRLWSSPTLRCLSEPMLVTLLLLDPLAVSVIELCDGCVLKWILSDLMKHWALAESHRSPDCFGHFRHPHTALYGMYQVVNQTQNTMELYRQKPCCVHFTFLFMLFRTLWNVFNEYNFPLLDCNWVHLSDNK